MHFRIYEYGYVRLTGIECIVCYYLLVSYSLLLINICYICFLIVVTQYCIYDDEHVRLTDIQFIVCYYSLDILSL